MVRHWASVSCSTLDVRDLNINEGMIVFSHEVGRCRYAVLTEQTAQIFPCLLGVSVCEVDRLVPVLTAFLFC